MTMSALPALRGLFDSPPQPAPEPLQVVIEIPGPPRGKGRPRFVRATGRTFTDPKTENYEGMLRQAGADAMGGRRPFEGPVWVILEIIFPVPTSWSLKKQAAALRREIWPTTKPDSDNTLKLFGDGLNGIVWRDDSQVVKVEVIKRYGDRVFTRMTAGPLA